MHVPYIYYGLNKKCLERFPLNTKNEAEKWAQCIDLVIDSFLDKNESLNNLNEKQSICQQIINEQKLYPYLKKNTSNQQKIWPDVLYIISHIFLNELNNDFRQSYLKKLLDR
ncbi:unnamed protein product [Rotaria magnacalcarata]